MSLGQLLEVIRSYPIIDNHAHNLLLSCECEEAEFLSITSEAQGEALVRDTKTSLSHLRARRYLRELYSCDPEASWEDILSRRAQWLKERPLELFAKCFTGTYAILMDDGLGGVMGASKVYPYSLHDQFTEMPTKRIVRIETVAEACLVEITERVVSPGHISEEKLQDTIWNLFVSLFMDEIQKALDDPEVVGFKSVICYRTGLDVDIETPDVAVLKASLKDVVLDLIKQSDPSGKQELVDLSRVRIQSKLINDWLVFRTFHLISNAAAVLKNKHSKPVQFHTGLGDNDIDLRKSSPIHLKPLIETYPTVNVVLLHSAYPFTREAGYLATVYQNCYLDIGEIFPQLSREGQAAALRQSFELVPFSKLLWSTDGHHFAETYYLANRQFRELLEDVIPKLVQKGDIEYIQAIDLVRSILFSNANKLYHLEYPAPETPSPSHIQSLNGREKLTSESVKRLREAKVSYVYVQYIDFMATLRTRILPLNQFTKLLSNSPGLSVSRGNTGTLQDDQLSAVCNPVGSIYLRPDLDSLYLPFPGQSLNAASVLCSWHDYNGDPLPLCPRKGLVETQDEALSLVNQLKSQHGIALLVGFEIEVTFLYLPNDDDEGFRPLTKNHSWGSLSSEDQMKALPLLVKIVEALEVIGIFVEQFHSESGNGQYEIVLPPKPPLAAIDSLVRARVVIQEIAYSFGLRATYHPMPLPGVGTAAHAHVSLNSPTGVVPVDTEMKFWGGVLRHLEAICAFTLPEEASYQRVVEDSWTGGIWVAWGEENRETPLRRVCDGARWEVRCLDGFANMYFAIRAIIAAGLLGLAGGEYEEVMQPPCSSEYTRLTREKALMFALENPSKMSDDERRNMGLRAMPRDLDTALQALDKDERLQEKIGNELVHDYILMKKAEKEKLQEMGNEQSKKWLIERY